MRYRIAKHGTVFSTRNRGAEVRAQIEAAMHHAKAAEPFVLDFSGVELISFSVADEVVGRLLADRVMGNLGERPILVADANEEVLDPIVRSLQRRGLVGAHFTGESLELLGVPPHLQSTFDAARQRGEFRTTGLAADLGISVPACNNRLKPLLAAGLLTRRRGIASSGGREFVYRVASFPVEHGLGVA